MGSVLSCRVIGVLQFDVDELYHMAFAKRSILLGDRSIFPYKREEIKEMRRRKKEEVESRSCVTLISNPVIESDDECSVC